jgi:putative phosphoribosyl transferase
MARFKDRVEAGSLLAAKLADHRARNPVVLALPRGGVPVAFPIAHALAAPLDIWVVRKLGAPGQPELGVGAVAEGGFAYINHDIVENLKLAPQALAEAVEQKRSEVAARVQRLRGDRPRPVLRDRAVIVVDDGIATGGTVRATIASLREEHPRSIALVVPVVAADVARALEYEVDELVFLRAPRDLYAIGQWYEDFTQVSDEEVKRLLERARHDLQDRAS